MPPTQEMTSSGQSYNYGSQYDPDDPDEFSAIEEVGRKITNSRKQLAAIINKPVEKGDVLKTLKEDTSLWKEKVCEILKLEREYQECMGGSWTDNFGTNLFQYVVESIASSTYVDEPMQRAKHFADIVFDIEDGTVQPPPFWTQGQSPLRVAVNFDQQVPYTATPQGSNSNFEDSLGLTVHIANIIERIAGPEAAESAIGELDNGNENILHLALRYDLPDAEALIQKAGQQSFRDQRISDGNTPLHEAVKFSHFTMKWPLCVVIPTPDVSATTPIHSSASISSAHHEGTASGSGANAGVPQQELDTAVTVDPAEARPAEPSQPREVSGSPMCITCRKAYKNVVSAQKIRSEVVQAMLTRDPGAQAVRNKAGVPPHAYLEAAATAWATLSARQEREAQVAPGAANRHSAHPAPPHASSQARDQDTVLVKSVLQTLGRKNETPEQPSSLSDGSSEGQLREGVPGNSKMPVQLIPFAVLPKKGTVVGKQAVPNIIPKHTFGDLREIDIGSAGVLKMLRDAAYHLTSYEDTRDALFCGNPSLSSSNSFPDATQSELFLDLAESSQRVSPLTPVCFNFLKLEHVMASITLSLPQPGERQQRGDPDIEWAQDQQNMLGVFRWLKTAKSVEEVLRLTVKDNPLRPCSDFTVKECLSGLQVRYLDWNKPDLCANNVTLPTSLLDMHLYWSGLDSVLWGWSDTQGLQTLPELRRVEIHYKELDSKLASRKGKSMVDEDKEKYEAFRARVEQWSGRNHLEIQQNRGHPLGFVSNEIDSRKTINIKTHPWMQRAEAFVSALRGKYQADPTSGEPPKARPIIKIALLDDGVDPTYGGADLGNSLHHIGWPRVNNTGEPSENAAHRKFYVSEYQHGSKMAWLIHKVCPFATIYVAKLSNQRTSNDIRSPSFRLEDAVEAIKWADSQNVDIISMSWNAREFSGSDSSTSNAADIAKLKDAIFKAQEHHILMFGAACETKAAAGDKFMPCDLHEVWSIGATDEFNDPKKYVNPNKVDYLFPGEYVLSSDKPEDADVGNSGATTLAAGFTAMLMFLAMAEGLHIPEDRHMWVDSIMETMFKCHENSGVVHFEVLEDALKLSNNPLAEITRKLNGA